MKVRVLEQVRIIVGETREASADQIFKYRTTAARQVYDSLTPDEKVGIQHKIENLSHDPIPAEVQQK